MQLVCWLFLVSGFYPVAVAWQTNRRTSLLSSVYWTLLAWLAWIVALAGAQHWPASAALAGRYVALCLTGCAGVAVLGARRPGMHAWNFVVAALLAVNLLPLAEGLFTGGTLELSGLRTVCVAATLAVGILNYLPTRLAPAALLLLLGCALEGIDFLAPAGWVHRWPIPPAAGHLALAGVPWLAYACWRSKRPARSAFDRVWLDFRDRFGLVWGQRLREQFNRSAAHAGWPVVLGWQGLRLLPGADEPEPVVQETMVTTLRALLKRFLEGDKVTR